MPTWLNPDGLITTYLDSSTLVQDREGDDRFFLPGTLPPELLRAIAHLCNRVYSEGITHGRAAKAAELRQVLEEGLSTH